MKKGLTLFCAFFIIFSMCSFCVYAQEVSNQNIILNLSFGERSGVYSGTMEDGLPNGEGKFESQNSEGIAWYYEGNFVNGHFEGKGLIVWETSGIKEEGTYKDDLLNGFGKQYKHNILTMVKK